MFVRTGMDDDQDMSTAHPTGSVVFLAVPDLQILDLAGAYDRLTELGAVATAERVVPLWDRRIVTAAGGSSGIDMALTVIAHLVDDVAAMAAQLETEYDPQPPFDSGSTAKASPEVLERVREYSRVRS